MKGAIASVEVFVRHAGEPPRRLTLTISAPVRDAQGGWSCRVALADRHRPETVAAADSVSALASALALGREWLEALQQEGAQLHRDRAGERAFEWPRALR